MIELKIEAYLHEKKIFTLYQYLLVYDSGPPRSSFFLIYLIQLNKKKKDKRGARTSGGDHGFSIREGLFLPLLFLNELFVELDVLFGDVLFGVLFGKPEREYARLHY